MCARIGKNSRKPFDFFRFGVSITFVLKLSRFGYLRTSTHQEHGELLIPPKTGSGNNLSGRGLTHRGSRVADTLYRRGHQWRWIPLHLQTCRSNQFYARFRTRYLYRAGGCRVTCLCGPGRYIMVSHDRAPVGNCNIQQCGRLRSNIIVVQRCTLLYIILSTSNHQSQG